ncbi:DNA-binding response regulator [Emticicia aquatilis]|uniref:DNA-binding response regulator n=1 Tax=Emticicia aquatilis TaxID=1537369 RepID=A0A917DTG3_9BACT|nr:response regulator transcription factor [Emticicia aquatilis]GGD67259.1 DNA-binding response regulator [Emticicia aquatilis]
MIRVLIADDHVIVAESLSILIDTMDGIEVVGTANNGWQVLTFLETNEVDIVLADLHMPLMNGIETTIRVREKYSKVRVMLLTMSEEPAVIKEALVAGVDGYIMKRTERKELELALKTVANGQRYFSEAVVMRLAQLPNQNTPSGKDEISENIPLTPREIEVMQLVIQDLSNIEIAERIFINVTTVETHRRNLMKKVGVNSALGLMRWAMKNGFLK